MSDNPSTERTERNMHDPLCDQLARTFLPNDATPADIDALAEHIQDAAEDWLDEKDATQVHER